MVQAEKGGKLNQDTVYRVDIKFAQQKRILRSIQYDRTQSSSTIHSQRIVSRNKLWLNLKKQCVRRYMCHLDHHRKFLTKIIGCVDWILRSLEAAKIPNESNQKPNYQVWRDPYVDKSPQRKSRNVPSLITTLLVKRNMMKSQTQQVRGDPFVDQNPQSAACWHLNMLKKIKQVRRDPYWWIKKRSTKLISEDSRTVTCSCEKKQNISEFKSLRTRSKIIFIEKQFMPTCSRLTPTTHSAKNEGHVPNYVIKKGLTHGVRHGKTEEQIEYHVAWNAWNRCCKKVDSQG